MKTKLIIFMALTILSCTTFAQKKDSTNAQNTHHYENYWRVKINFDLPSLNPEAIQIGLLDFEPQERFISKFNMAYLSEHLKNAKDEKEKNMHINVQIDVTWNNLFNVVKGSEMYLLTKQGMILSQIAEYAKPKMKNWLVSKVFYIDGKPYCYSIPLELENGSKLEITLNSANLISLTDLYLKIKK